MKAVGWLAVATLIVLAAACGGPDRAEDEQRIRAVLIEDQVGGPGRCDEIYTDAYLAENWNAQVTAYPGSTPIEKCRNQPRLPGVTAKDVKVTVASVDGDDARASAQVRAQAAVTYTLARDGDGWRISGFVP